MHGSGGPSDELSLMVLFEWFMQNLSSFAVAEPEEVDPVCLEKAGEGVLLSLYSEVAVFADKYYLPGDLLWSVVVDWVVSDHIGMKRAPVKSLVPEKQGPKRLGVQRGTHAEPTYPPRPSADAEQESDLGS